MAKVEDVRRKAERLGSLKERRKQLDAEIAELERDLDRLGGTRRSDSVSDVLAARLVEVIEKASEPVSISYVVGRFPEAKEASIRGALSRLEREHRIRRVRRGVYAAATG